MRFVGRKVIIKRVVGCDNNFITPDKKYLVGRVVKNFGKEYAVEIIMGGMQGSEVACKDHEMEIVV